MDTEQIEDQIELALKAIPGQFPGRANDSEWTKAVLLAVGTLGKNLGYDVCGLREHFEPGWLFDLCWYSCLADGKLLNLHLALESEWDVKYAAIKYDFEKLLIAKSQFKVLVFQAKGQKAADYIKEFEQGIHAYKGGCLGEIYLLACYDEEDEEFVIKKVAGV